MQGIVKDKENKPFAFANIYISDANGKPTENVGTTTDQNGLFSFAFPANKYITVSTIESSEKLTFYNTGKQYIEIILKRGYELSEVEIKAKKIKKALNVAFIFGLVYTILNN